MSHVKGTAFRAYPNTGSYAVPVYTAITGEGSMTFGASMSPINVNDKDSAGWEEILDGLKNWNISATIKYDDADTAVTAIKTDFLAGTLHKIKAKTLDLNMFSGDCYITDIGFTSPHDGIVEMSATFKGTGACAEGVAA